MKKILSVLLVVCMLATSCLFFASCNKVKAKDIEKDPTGALSEAMSNTTADFFGKNTDVSKILQQAFEKKGAIGISFESEDLDDMLGEDFKVTETLYLENQERIVSDTQVTIMGETLAARIFGDKNGIMLNSKDILGDDTTYALNLDNLSQKLKDSILLEMAGLSEEELNEIFAMLDKAEEAMKKTAEENEKKFNDLVDAIYDLMEQTVTNETITNAEGKKVKCVVVTYTINNNNLKAIVEKVIDDVYSDFLDADMKAEMEEGLDEAFKEMNEAVEINLTAKVCIERKTNEVEMITFTGTVAPKESDEETVTIDLKLVFGDTEISLAGEVKVGEEVASVAVKMIKEEKDGGLKYELTANVAMKMDGTSVDMELLKVTYDRKSAGDFVLSATIGTGASKTEASIKGKVVTTDKEVTLTINEVKADKETIDGFVLTISVKVVDEIPAAPTDAKDVLTLTEGQIVDMVNAIQESKLFELIGSFAGGNQGEPGTELGG